MNLVQRAVSQGGKLAPIVFPHDSTAIMNPSIFVDSDGDILVNVRATNYILVHSENEQKFPSKWGPLSYLHPEQDQTLRTENYLVRLNSNLEVTDHTKVEMLNLHTPIWEFIGLEDARLVEWNGDYFLIGVRRDTTSTGVGRMEYTLLDLDKKKWTAKETKRQRIPAPDPDTSYCEKNWYPVNDTPYTFIKWTMPTEVVYAEPWTDSCKQIIVKPTFDPPADQRGSSQLIRWGNMYISITHEVDLFKNYLNQKDGIYRHRLLLWDDHFNLVGISPENFSFLDFRIEFCVGAAVYEDDLLLSFSTSDNAAFVLRVPKLVVEDMILEALTYENR
jgi:hypothetical protein